MTFSPQWQTAWSEKAVRPVGPNPDFSLIIEDIARSSEQNLVALELGCGQANNYQMFKHYDIKYFGIDGSQDAIDKATERYPELKDYLRCEDFTQRDLPASCFNIVCDRASVSHNDSKSIRRTIASAREALVIGGVYVGVDWFSSKHTEFSRGTTVDSRTRTNYPDGQFKGIGRVHFTDEDELREIFSGFDIWMLRERTICYPPGFPTENYAMQWVANEFIGCDYVSAVYDILARKI